MRVSGGLGGSQKQLPFLTLVRVRVRVKVRVNVRVRVRVGVRVNDAALLAL